MGCACFVDIFKRVKANLTRQHHVYAAKKHHFVGRANPVERSIAVVVVVGKHVQTRKPDWAGKDVVQTAVGQVVRRRAGGQ